MPSDILAEICARKRAEVMAALEMRSLEAVKAEADEAGQVRDFTAALETDGISLISEIKRASPSKGEIAPDLDAAAQAAAYQSAGASAISVLTDAEGFAGSLADLVAARESCGLPVLRKDFLIDPYQLYEARAAGADAVLLIVAALGSAQLEEMIGLAGDLDMASLVEVHDLAELRIALDAGAGILGVNNRDLRSFEVSLTTCIELAEAIPSWVIGVAESGIASRADVQLIESAGYDAVLVGESLLISGNVETQIRELLGR